MVLFREPCSVFGSFAGTGPAGEGNKSFSFATLCLDDLPKPNKCLVSPHSHRGNRVFSFLFAFKTNLLLPMRELGHMVFAKQICKFHACVHLVWLFPAMVIYQLEARCMQFVLGVGEIPSAQPTPSPPRDPLGDVQLPV